MVARIGILALQGDVREHEAALRRAGCETATVRRAGDLGSVDGLVLPGGESTTIARLLEERGLVEPIQAFAASGRPVWGVCAGLVLLARDEGPEPDHIRLGLLDVALERNAFGRQVESFETDIDIAGIPGGPFHAVFIRAPAIRSTGHSVEALARLADGTVVAARQNNVLGTAFHPELTEDIRLHAYFLALAAL